MEGKPSNANDSLEDAPCDADFMYLYSIWHETRANFKAAGHADTSALEGLLRQSQHLSKEERHELVINAVHDDVSPDGNDWDSVLLHAISHHRPQNVAFLLNHGANPNGMDLELLETYSLRFRRVQHKPIAAWGLYSCVSTYDVGDATSQVAPITDEDLHVRSSAVSKFWCDVDAPPLEAAPNGSLIHALVMAARHSDVEIFDMLVEAGADMSFWIGDDLPVSPTDKMASSLVVQTPLHAAIDADDTTMLAALLQRRLSHGRLNPNCRALITGSQALTPWQYAIVQGKIEAYQLIASHPLTDLSLVTPILGVHLLFFAVAQLRLDLVQLIDLPLSTAAPTALAQTLLHVACLPLDDNHAQFLAPKVRQSIHDVRTFVPWWGPGLTLYDGTNPTGQIITREKISVESGPHIDGPGDSKLAPMETLSDHVLPLERRRKISEYTRGDLPSPEPHPQEYHDAQMQMVRMIITSLGEAELAKTDVYNNTPLHYLASARIVNDELVAWVRSNYRSLGDEIWTESKNRWGWTPADLWLDNVITVEPRLEDVPGLPMYRGVLKTDPRAGLPNF